MRMPISLTYALRSLWRNPRRTILSALGISVGIVIALTMTGFMFVFIGFRIWYARKAEAAHTEA